MKNAFWRILILLLFILTFGFWSCDCDEEKDDTSRDPKSEDEEDDDDDTSDDDSSESVTCYRDSDGDGYGDPNVTITVAANCSNGWVENDEDCDDTDKYVNPNGIELPDDGIDQDCLDGDFTATDENGIFVSTTGADGATGIKSDPMNNLIEAMAKAASTNQSVFVAAGSYYETVEVETSMYGGYNATFSKRDIQNNLTAITGTADGTLLVMQGVNSVINGFKISGPLEPTQSIAVGIVGSGTMIDNNIYGFTVSSDSFGIAALYPTAVLKAYKNRIFGGGGGAESTGILVKAGTKAILMDNDINGGTGTLSIGVDIEDSTAEIQENDINGGSGFNAIALISKNSELTLSNNNIFGGYTSKKSDSKAEASVGVDVLGGYATVSGNIIDGGESNITSAVVAFGNELLLDANWIYGGKGTSENTGVTGYHNTTLVNNFIYGGDNNSGSSSAVRIYDGEYTLVNNTLVGGKGFNGIGIFLNNATVKAVNNIIDGGEMSSSSTGITIHMNGGNVSLISNDIYSSSLDYMIVDNAILISDISEVNDCANWPASCVESLNNISKDPNYLDALHGDYHIGPGACVDSGTDPSLWYSGDPIHYDFDGDERPAGDGWDIGMDEKSP